MTHPFFFTWSAQQNAKPLTLLGGEGAHFDTDEGRFLDLGSLVYQANLGHGHPKMIQALQDQVASLSLTMPSALYPAKTEAAEALLQKAPEGFSKVFFCLGGAEANENALKIARLHTGRYKAIARYRSYHGATMGAVSLTGDWRRTAVEPGIPGVIHVLDLDRGAPTQIPRTLELEENVAAVFLEPIVGANGVLIPPPGYFQEIREACDRAGALLVVDEVLTGFGRTGKFFAHEHEGITPDIITCGKGLTGGYGVLGAVLVHERIAQTFEETVLACGLTQYAHPLGVASAHAAIQVYDEENLVEKAAALEAPFLAGLQALADEFEFARDPRGRGLLGAVDLHLSEEGLAKFKSALRAARIHAFVKGRKQLREDNGALVLAPPLCISEEELSDGFTRISQALRTV